MKATTSFARIRTRIVVACAVILPVAMAALPQPLAAPGAAQASGALSAGQLGADRHSTELGTILNRDGTLNLDSGFRGSLDAKGWQMISDPGTPPRFVRFDPDTHSKPPLRGAAPQVPGDENWDGRFGTDSVNTTVFAVAVSATGDVYVGGDFTTAGGATANHIARWNQNGWAPLGIGVNAPVQALAVSGTGALYVGGDFTTAGGVSANHIAMWSGGSWSPLGSGVDNIVESLAVSSTGDLYAGGFFGSAGGVSASHIAMWSSRAWSALGSGVDNAVQTIAISGLTGDLYAGGLFTTAGGVSANYIALWNGASWAALGSGTDNYVFSIALDGNGGLYAGGRFLTAGGLTVNHIAHWSGSSWSALGSGMDNDVTTVVVSSADSYLYAGGAFTTAGGVSAVRIARWDGSAWSPFLFPGSGMDSLVYALAQDVSNGHLYAGGSFTSAAGVLANYVAEWDGSAFSPLGSGTTGPVYAIAAAANGDVYAGGAFRTAGGVGANYIAKWDGSDWSPLGSRVSNGTNNVVGAIAIGPSGDVYAGGPFIMAGGLTVNYIARWNGTSWSPLGSGMNPSVNAIAVSSTGDVYAGGGFTTAGGVAANHIARWNGSAWTPLGSGPNNGTDGSVDALAISTTGDVYAAGRFTTAGGISANHIARWSGGAWSALGTGVGDDPYDQGAAVAVDPTTGDVYATGYFTMTGGTTVNNIARWNGSTWSALGSGPSNGLNGGGRSLAIGADGSLYVGGSFTTAGGISANHIARWSGGAWSALGGGAGGTVWSMGPSRSTSDLFAGGEFTIAGGKESSYFGLWHYPASPTPTATPTRTPGAPTPTPTATSCPIRFTDVPAGSTFYPYITCLACRGIVTGYTSSPPCATGAPCFLPQNNVTRGQMAKFVSNAAGYSDTIPASRQTFADVPHSSTFWLYIERAYAHNVIGGYTTPPRCPSGTPCFIPGGNVTRGQTAKFVSNAAGYLDTIPPNRQTFTDVPPSSTFWLYVERVYMHGIVSGYSTSPPCTGSTPCFLPGNSVTRGQTAKFISNAFFPDCNPSVSTERQSDTR